MTERVVGVNGAAALMQVSTQRVRQLLALDQLPEPDFVELTTSSKGERAARPLWLAEPFELWAIERAEAIKRVGRGGRWR